MFLRNLINWLGGKTSKNLAYQHSTNNTHRSAAIRRSTLRYLQSRHLISAADSQEAIDRFRYSSKSR